MVGRGGRAEDEVSSVVEPTSLEESAEAGAAGRTRNGTTPPGTSLTEAVDIAAVCRRRRHQAGGHPGSRDLAFSTGETVDVDRAILVGRAPEPGPPPDHRAALPGGRSQPQKEISSTHLEVRPGTGADHGSAVVTDLGSTNGTVLVQPGLPPRTWPGCTVPLQPGAILDVGDGVTIKVSAPESGWRS